MELSRRDDPLVGRRGQTSFPTHDLGNCATTAPNGHHGHNGQSKGCRTATSCPTSSRALLQTLPARPTLFLVCPPQAEAAVHRPSLLDPLPRASKYSPSTSYLSGSHRLHIDVLICIGLRYHTSTRVTLRWLRGRRASRCKLRMTPEREGESRSPPRLHASWPALPPARVVRGCSEHVPAPFDARRARLEAQPDAARTLAVPSICWLSQRAPRARASCDGQSLDVGQRQSLVGMKPVGRRRARWVSQYLLDSLAHSNRQARSHLVHTELSPTIIGCGDVRGTKREGRLAVLAGERRSKSSRPQTGRATAGNKSKDRQGERQSRTTRLGRRRRSAAIARQQRGPHGRVPGRAGRPRDLAAGRRQQDSPEARAPRRQAAGAAGHAGGRAQAGRQEQGR